MPLLSNEFEIRGQTGEDFDRGEGAFSWAYTRITAVDAKSALETFVRGAEKEIRELGATAAPPNNGRFYLFQVVNLSVESADLETFRVYPTIGLEIREDADNEEEIRQNAARAALYDAAENDANAGLPVAVKTALGLPLD
jgi:hypothetical protein